MSPERGMRTRNSTLQPCDALKAHRKRYRMCCLQLMLLPLVNGAPPHCSRDSRARTCCAHSQPFTFSISVHACAGPLEAVEDMTATTGSLLMGAVVRNESQGTLLPSLILCCHHSRQGERSRRRLRCSQHSPAPASCRCPWQRQRQRLEDHSAGCSAAASTHPVRRAARRLPRPGARRSGGPECRQLRIEPVKNVSCTVQTQKKLLVDQYDALQAAIVHSTKKMALYQPYLAEWHYTEFHHLVD